MTVTVNDFNRLTAGRNSHAEGSQSHTDHCQSMSTVTQSHENDKLRLVRGSILRRVDTVTVSVNGLHQAVREAVLGTLCKLVCVKTLILFQSYRV